MKLRYIFMAIASLGLFAACNPLTEEYELNNSQISAEELQVTATVKQVDGKYGNVIVRENHSPLLSQWTVADKSYTKAYAETTVSYTGDHVVKFHGMNDGAQSFSDKELTVHVDTISTIPADIASRLCIGQSGAPTYFGTTLDLSKISVSVDEGIVTVTNANPVLTHWEMAGVEADKNIAQLKMTKPGTFMLKATFTLANGKQVTREMGNVKVKPFNLPEIVTNLVGKDGKKTWTWEDKNFFGFGGYAASMGPEWFVYDASTMGLYAGYFGMTGEPTGSWTLDVEGNFSVNPTRRTGTFSYDFDDKVPNWSVGKLKVDNPILFGTSISMSTYQPSYLPKEFYIVKCDADHLVLAAMSEKDATPAAYAPCVFWCFKAQK